MTRIANPRRLFGLFAASLMLGILLFGAGLGRADSTPIGPLPAGSVATTTTKPGLLVAVALPRPSAGSGLVWRVARPYNAAIVREISEADVGSSVVLVYKVVGRGNTSLIFALTRGDASAKAAKSATQKIHSV